MRSKDLQINRKIYWQKLESIFHDVLSYPTEHRQAYLIKVCEDNYILFKDVESLVVAYDKATGEGFLDFTLKEKH